MRGLPFFKPKKGAQFAGLGFSDGSGSGGSSYILPIASANTLGGVKIGSGLDITEQGVLSASGGGGGGGISFTDTETKIGTYGESDLFCKKVSVSDDVFTTDDYVTIQAGNVNVVYASLYCTAQFGQYQKNRYYLCNIETDNTINSNKVFRLGVGLSSGQVVANSGYAYIFYTKY